MCIDVVRIGRVFDRVFGSDRVYREDVLSHLGVTYVSDNTATDVDGCRRMAAEREGQ